MLKCVPKQLNTDNRLHDPRSAAVLGVTLHFCHPNVSTPVAETANYCCRPNVQPVSLKWSSQKICRPNVCRPNVLFACPNAVHQRVMCRCPGEVDQATCFEDGLDNVSSLGQEDDQVDVAPQSLKRWSSAIPKEL